MARYIIVLLLLSTTAALHAVVIRDQSHDAVTSAPPELLNLPSRIMGFAQWGADQEAPESVRRLLETNTILTRTYLSPSGWPVQLTIVYAEKTRRSLHFPEVCFTGQGWETRGKMEVPVGLDFMGQGLTLEKDGNREAVIYWFQTGGTCTSSYVLNSYYWLRDKLLLRDPSTMLVRVSVPIADRGEEFAYGIGADFGSALAPLLMDRAV